MSTYLEVTPVDIGNIHIVRRWTQIVIFLVGEDVNANQVNFSVAVLASFRRGHFNHFARTTLRVKEKC